MSNHFERLPLTDETLVELSGNHQIRRAHATESAHYTEAGFHLQSALAIDELLEFRKGVNGPLRVLERNLAYNQACTSITSFCMTWEDSATDIEWHNTAEIGAFGAQDVKDAVLYLDLKGLLYRHPLELNCVRPKERPDLDGKLDAVRECFFDMVKALHSESEEA